MSLPLLDLTGDISIQNQSWQIYDGTHSHCDNFKLIVAWQSTISIHCHTQANFFWVEAGLLQFRAEVEKSYACAPCILLLALPPCICLG